MKDSAFIELHFFLLIATSLIMPTGIYVFLLKTRAIARSTTAVFGFALIMLSVADVYFLKSLSRLAHNSPSLLDDQVFNSELSLALYLLPAVFGGIGVNLISHALISHLARAERQFEREHHEQRKS